MRIKDNLSVLLIILIFILSCSSDKFTEYNDQDIFLKNIVKVVDEYKIDNNIKDIGVVIVEIEDYTIENLIVNIGYIMNDFDVKFNEFDGYILNKNEPILIKLQTKVNLPFIILNFDEVIISQIKERLIDSDKNGFYTYNPIQWKINFTKNGVQNIIKSSTPKKPPLHFNK